MAPNKNETEVEMVKLQADMSYMKQVLDRHSGNFEKIFVKMDAFSDKVDKKIREYAAPKVVGIIVYGMVAIILGGFIKSLI